MSQSRSFACCPVLIAFCGWLLLCGCEQRAPISVKGGYTPAKGVATTSTQASEGTPADVTESNAPATKETPQKKAEIIVLVAASAQEAMGELANTFSAAEGVSAHISADDSSRLAQQIIAGAPGDLFLSASPKWVDVVDEKGLVVAKTPLLANTLVAIAPAKVAEANPPLTLETLAEHPKSRLAIAGPTVPAGMYGRQALRHHDWLEKLEKQEQLVIGGNVREVLAYVERGEAEIGIVYATDAMISKDVRVVHTFAADSHDPIVYPLALIKSEGENSEVARRFYEFLRSEQAAAVFAKYGFAVPKK